MNTTTTLAELDHLLADMRRQNEANAAALAVVEAQIRALGDRMCGLLESMPGRDDLDAAERESDEILAAHHELSARRRELKGRKE